MSKPGSKRAAEQVALCFTQRQANLTHNKEFSWNVAILFD